jgi:ATP-dependent Lon protease
VLIPQENEKDLADIPDNVKSALEIIPVNTMDEVLAKALTRQPVAIEWNEVEPVTVAPVDEDAADAVGLH